MSGNYYYKHKQRTEMNRGCPQGLKDTQSLVRLQSLRNAVDARPHGKPCTDCLRCSLAGVYTISALIGEEHMSGSPAEVEASTAQAHGPHCEVVGAPLTLHTTAGAKRHSSRTTHAWSSSAAAPAAWRLLHDCGAFVNLGVSALCLVQ